MSRGQCAAEAPRLLNSSVPSVVCNVCSIQLACCHFMTLTLTVLVATIDAQWEGMGDIVSARYEPALLPPWPTIRVLSYSNWSIFRNSAL